MTKVVNTSCPSSIIQIEMFLSYNIISSILSLCSRHFPFVLISQWTHFSDESFYERYMNDMYSTMHIE